MWIIISIILAVITILTLISNAYQSDRIKGLEYQLGYKRDSIQKLMIDTDNKVVVYQFMPGVSKKSLEDFKNASKTLTNKDYLVLAVDETFEVSKINFSDDDIKKIKDEWDKRIK